jgi:hypothetical protein
LSKYWNNENKKSYYFRNQIIPWNENSLYKTDVLDYDDKDVDIEGDNSNRYVKSMSENHITQDYQTEQTDIAKPDEITVNYLESDTQDFYLLMNLSSHGRALCRTYPQYFLSPD